MRRKNTTTYMMKEYITEALLQLMKKKEFEKLTIEEITTKAGVNRSTYYRNFKSKEMIIEFYFDNILFNFFEKIKNENIVDFSSYLKNLLKYYYQERENLLLIYKQGLSYIFLDELNKIFFNAEKNNKLTDKEKIYRYYHIGGIFNIFSYWFSTNMDILPEVLADISVSFLPTDFKPFLFKINN